MRPYLFGTRSPRHPPPPPPLTPRLPATFQPKTSVFANMEKTRHGWTDGRTDRRKDRQTHF